MAPHTLNSLEVSTWLGVRDRGSALGVGVRGVEVRGEHLERATEGHAQPLARGVAREDGLEGLLEDVAREALGHDDVAARALGERPHLHDPHLG